MTHKKNKKRKIKWTITQKIVGLTSILIFFIVVLLIFSIFSLSKIQDDLRELDKFDVPLVRIANFIEIHMLEQEISIDELLELSHYKKSEKNEAKKEFLKAKFFKNSKKLEGQFEKGIPLSKEATSFTDHSERFEPVHSSIVTLKKDSIQLHDFLLKILKVIDQNKKPSEDTVLKLLSLQVRFDTQAMKLIKAIEELTERELELAEKHEKLFFYVEIIIGFSAIVLGIFFSFIIILSIKNKLFKISSKIREVNDALVKNKIIPSKTIDVEDDDEIGEVASQLSSMINSFSKDIKKRDALLKHMKKVATTDTLTGLSNRHSYNEFIEYEYNRANRSDKDLSLIMFDIDNFKKINDTYGHDIGDLVLIELAKTVRGLIRQIDSVFRIGGEEFVIITPYTSGQQASKLAEIIREKIEEHRFDTVNSVTISLGIHQCGSKDTIESIYKKADKAMYRSKKSGKNRVSVY
ncbi:MAG: GGDEF domain-containing protein [Desulfobacterales bacterium]|nr:GGDEF domain-containing protein [Desulfobacterales bacterium]